MPQGGQAGMNLMADGAVGAGAVDVYLDEQLHHGSGSAVYPLRLADG